MEPKVDPLALAAAVQRDAELAYKLRGLTAKVRVDLPSAPIEILVQDGVIAKVASADASAADVVMSAPAAFWSATLSERLPRPGYESLTMGRVNGLALEGDLNTLIAPYQAAWQRLFAVVREAVAGRPPRASSPEPFRDTDTAVGRYVYLRANGAEARIYYEEAGSGDVPLLLQSTAGGDGRQYRHLLADPAMQQRFRMIAYDLPYHGKSLPPLGETWWAQPYRPTKDWMMGWVVALADALGLERPVFMGCSVGGQLALDLAAEHGERFGGFVALNGWYDPPPMFSRMDNDLFRTPAVSEDLPMSQILGATAPTAPEAHAQEVYWIYRSNYPGVYAGDNDYFCSHDLKAHGHRIDAARTPLYLVSGEYDSSAHDLEHGAPAVAAKIPGAIYREAKGMGHFSPTDDPTAFSAMILPVLDEILVRLGAKPWARPA